MKATVINSSGNVGKSTLSNYLVRTIATLPLSGNVGMSAPCPAFRRYANGGLPPAHQDLRRQARLIDLPISLKPLKGN